MVPPFISIASSLPSAATKNILAKNANRGRVVMECTRNFNMECNIFASLIRETHQYLRAFLIGNVGIDLVVVLRGRRNTD
jgi:hypothetical protein